MQAQNANADPFLAVRDLRANSRWSAALLAADTMPDHNHCDSCDRISVAGRLVLQRQAP